MGIRLLPPAVSSKIAAGEVIDGPAAVVKELLENSLDAGAASISVDIKTGGIEYLRVVDNGAGIPGDEVELAFERFATSKVAAATDLDGIATLGFRGEALPSIAAVSLVSLVTRTAEEDSATRVEVVDGEVVGHQAEGAALGTAITVRQLFRNLPARRKFLRTAAAEASRIQTLVTRYALAYPAVQFRLSLDGSPAFGSPGSGDLREAVAQAYQADLAHAMLDLQPPLPPGDPRAPVPSGMISPPSFTRSNRSHITLFVNGRWVQSRTLTYALEQAYRGFLKERRFPIAVVNITLPYDDVDVNVHPSKAEVRFHNQGLVFSALQQAVRHTLTSLSPVPELTGTSDIAVGGLVGPDVSSRRSPDSALQDHVLPSEAEAQEGAPPELSQPLVPRSVLPVLRVLGQAQRTYIAAEGPDGVYLIDQHAAHERVLFERVRAASASEPAQVQGLIEPSTVELDPRHAELLESHAELIGRLGFDVEAFGPGSFILRGVPALLAEGDPAQHLIDVLDLMADGGGFQTWEERAAYSLACHGAIRAGKVLSPQEMSELTRQLEACRQPHTCPHGRPTMIHLSTSRIEREFGRR